MQKVLMQMIHILQHTLPPTNNHIINSAEMLRVFRESYAAAMGYDRDTEFCGYEEDGEDFVDAADAAGVDLADVDGAGLDELLEHYAVLAHFACGNADA